MGLHTSNGTGRIAHGRALHRTPSMSDIIWLIPSMRVTDIPMIGIADSNRHLFSLFEVHNAGYINASHAQSSSEVMMSSPFRTLPPAYVAMKACMAFTASPSCALSNSVAFGFVRSSSSTCSAHSSSQQPVASAGPFLTDDPSFVFVATWATGT
jgi:hypothetical protein